MKLYQTDTIRFGGTTKTIRKSVWIAGMGVLLATTTAMAQPSDRVLDAIQQVESSGVANPPDGDGGKAIGPFQIWKDYWTDAVAFDKTIGGTYQDCRKPEYARKVVIAYITRYGGKNVSDEVAARLHNGGPRFAKKTGKALQKLNKYWAKVKKHLK